MKLKSIQVLKSILAEQEEEDIADNPADESQLPDDSTEEPWEWGDEEDIEDEAPKNPIKLLVQSDLQMSKPVITCCIKRMKYSTDTASIIADVR